MGFQRIFDEMDQDDTKRISLAEFRAYVWKRFAHGFIEGSIDQLQPTNSSIGPPKVQKSLSSPSAQHAAPLARVPQNAHSHQPYPPGASDTLNWSEANANVKAQHVTVPPSVHCPDHASGDYSLSGGSDFSVSPYSNDTFSGNREAAYFQTQAAGAWGHSVSTPGTNPARLFAQNQSPAMTPSQSALDML